MELCDDMGIKHELSTKYILQSIGLVEGKNIALIDMVGSMICEYNASDAFRVEAIDTTCDASNKLYCHWILKNTPYELLI